MGASLRLHGLPFGRFVCNTKADDLPLACVETSPAGRLENIQHTKNLNFPLHMRKVEV